MTEEPQFVSGACCLDFANTVWPRGGGEPEGDHVPGYSELLGWSRLAGVLTADDESELRRRAEPDPAAARRAHARAIALRETIYVVFLALAEAEPVPAAELAALRTTYLQALDHAELEQADDDIDWHWPESARTLDYPRWRLADDAVRLLRSERRERISTCEDCVWLFIDTTKNRSRRWCSMGDCGTQQKIRRQTERRRRVRTTT